MSAPGPHWTAADVIACLEARRSDTNIAGMARYGIETRRAFGASNAVLRPMARQLGRNHARAMELWTSGWREARLLAAFTIGKGALTPDQAHAWAADFDSWEIVDGVADVFADAPFWRQLIDEFAADQREFVRRSAFAMMAWAAVHRKAEPDATFIALLPQVEVHATDPRNYVRKAVNWALRSIGKRSPACHGPALALAETLAASDDHTARWIGRHAVRELNAPATLERIARRKPV